MYNSEANLLEDALTQNISLEHSCKTGDCGVCKCEVLSGSVMNENRQVVTQGHVLACQSKALSNVVVSANYYPELDALRKQTVPCKVSKVTYLTKDIVALKFRLPPSSNFNYLPGQYVDLSFKGVVRSYSIANAKNATKELEFHIRRVHSGKMSNLIFENVKTDQLMRLEGPKGTFFVREGEKPLLFLATGTGIAPIKAMVEKLVATADPREIYIFWGMRYANEIYDEYFQILSKQLKQLHFFSVTSQEENENGYSGYVQDIVCKHFDSLERFDVYACGSLKMIDDAREKFYVKCLKHKAFHSDAFLPAKQLQT
ncbi:CDP-6-deoxy-delta-3,4-glucoseen reductase [Alginatibacterium sediminis]|uniref:CDP-6-deoxy-delta-3,4-glucoseen reductase n=1 Tax=Alginatibacterium sediminis TaxID=2164068 RepID=A0A420EAV5_9ALTE|nr:FAD-binding oxidoreductase [Alginatibacterium sediminis]RKF17816.1 CDP-6-deoxy-delta-3,4-glucoseen reductase [Alginatibacterium sediminis]